MMSIQSIMLFPFILMAYIAIAIASAVEDSILGSVPDALSL
jgi:hypothetical protein